MFNGRSAARNRNATRPQGAIHHQSIESHFDRIGQPDIALTLSRTDRSYLGRIQHDLIVDIERPFIFVLLIPIFRRSRAIVVIIKIKRAIGETVAGAIKGVDRRVDDAIKRTKIGGGIILSRRVLAGLIAESRRRTSLERTERGTISVAVASFQIGRHQFDA